MCPAAAPQPAPLQPSNSGSLQELRGDIGHSQRDYALVRVQSWSLPWIQARKKKRRKIAVILY